MPILRCILIVCALAATAVPLARAQEVKPALPQKIVILFSLDGLGHYYMDDPQAQMPTLRQLERTGARAQMMKVSNPSVTWPNHTTLVTGVHPARHGVVGNNFYDRRLKRQIALISDPIYDKTEIVKTPTIYDLAKENGLTTAAVRWPAARKAPTLDWNIPTVGNALLLTRYSTPGLLADCRAAGLFARGAFALGQPTTATSAPATQDAEQRTIDDDWTDAFILILKKHRPAFGMLHLAHIDHEQHQHGPRSPAAYEAIRHADEQVKRVIDAAEALYPGGVTVVIAADHGFSPINGHVLPNVALRQAGLVEVKEDRIVGGPVAIVVQGGAAMVYIVDPSQRETLIPRVIEALKKVDKIARIVGPGELHTLGMAEPTADAKAPDLVALAEFGSVFGDTASGDLPFVEKPERRGSHGHDTSYPELHAAFLAWGAGVKQGIRIGTVESIDVAPTVARLLGLEMKDVDGRVLEEILAR